MKLSALAEAIGLECPQGGDREIIGLNSLKDASSSEVSFLEKAAYVKELTLTKAAAVLVSKDLAEHVPEGTIALLTDEPYLTLAYATKVFAPAVIETEGSDAVVGEGVHIAPGVYLGKGSVIGSNVTILPNTFIGDNVRIGDNTIIHANVNIYRDCEVGANCIIHAGTVVGSDGFGFAPTRMGEFVKIYQNGNVVVEDDVELGANCAIDRAVFGTTRIKKGAKVDNLVHFGHNVELGEHSAIAGQCGFAGSTTLGRNTIMGGQCAVNGHLTVAPFNQFAGRSVITRSIQESKKTFGGFPIMEQRSWLKLQAKLAKLLK